MTLESALWFAGQLLVAVVALLVGRRIARWASPRWKIIASAAVALMLLWPAMRLYPASVLAHLGARLVMFIEVTGIIVPATVLFAIAAEHVPQRSERRALYAMLAICGLYFLQYGKWMVLPPVPDLGTTQLAGDVCMQSTNYTCVAASLVTLLRAHGVDATETEMARLSHTEPGHGTTDSRAIAALQRKLAHRDVAIHYEGMDYTRLCQVEMPCVVTVDWGYFTSHMVPVLSADQTSVVVGDPLIGRQQYGPDEFRHLWHGLGIYLTRPALTASKPPENRVDQLVDFR